MDILKAILDIEKKVQDISGAYDELKQKETEKTEKILSELEERALKERKEALLKYTEEIKAEFECELKESSALLSERIEHLEKFFSENEALWTEEIFERIITGDAE